MFRCTTFFLLIFSCALASFTQMPQTWHIHTEDRTPFSETIQATDAKGNSYVALFQEAGNLLIVKKHSNKGTETWSREFETGEYGFRIQPLMSQFDSEGNWFILATVQDGGGLLQNTILFKLGYKGQLKWVHEIEEPGNDEPQSLVIDEWDQISVLTFKEQNLRHNAVYRFDSDGTIAWSRKYSNSIGWQINPQICAGRDGNLWLSLLLDSQNSGQFLKKLSPDGTEIHSSEFYGACRMQLAQTIELEDGSLVYLDNQLLHRTGPNGTEIWEVDPDIYKAKKLFLTEAGNIILVGYQRVPSAHMRVSSWTQDGLQNWGIDRVANPATGEAAEDAVLSPNGYLYVVGYRSNASPPHETLPHYSQENYALYKISLADGSFRSESVFFDPDRTYASWNLTRDHRGNLYVSGKKQEGTQRYFFTSQHSSKVLEPNVEGLVYHEMGLDCQPSVGDSALPNQIIEVDGGQMYTFTDSAGNFSLALTHGSHTLNYLSPFYWYDPCQITPVTVNVDTTNPTPIWLDLPTDAQPDVVDMRVSLSAGPARPGFVQTHALRYVNVGTTTRTGVAWMELDTQFVYLQATPQPDSIIGDTLYWTYTNVPPGGSSTILIGTQLPPVTQLLGQFFTNCATVEPVTGDYTPPNNTDCFTDVIRGAFDPNDKTPFPTLLRPGDQDISYLIRFQNTGTDTAFNVVVRDTISELFDLSTFKMGAASHDYTVAFNPGRELVWTFNNILLPDSNRNEPASHGFFRFDLSTHPDLPLYTEIPNTAGIYFDFNEPIITNTAITTIEPVRPGGILDPGTLRIYPNPGTDVISVDADLEYKATYEWVLFDMMGKQLSAESGQYLGSPLSLSLTQLPAGVYLLKLQSQGIEWSGKVSKL